MNSKSDNDDKSNRPGNDNAFSQDDLAFFGRMTANVSHEFKNRLATINEKAGLLADLTTMAEQGTRSLDTARVKTIANDIARQVETANTACLRLNRFAHTADVPVRREDLNELLLLIARLSERQAMIAGIEINVESCPKVEIDVNPFLFQQLVYRCLKWGMDHASSRTISLGIEQKGDDTCVTIKGASFDGLSQQSSDNFVRLLRQLGGRLQINSDDNEVTVLLGTDRDKI